MLLNGTTRTARLGQNLGNNNQQRRLVAARLAAPRRADSPTAAPSPAGSAASSAAQHSHASTAAAAAAAMAAPLAAAAAADPATPASQAPVKAGWWTKKPAKGTLIDITSAQELVDVLADAGDRLVVVDVLASWCGACRGVFPKVLQLVEQYSGEGPPDPTAPGNAPADGVVFCKLNFDDNRKLAKTLGVRVLPYFMFFRGAEGRVAAFSCTTSKIERLRDALDFFSAGVCSLEPNPEVQEISRGWDIHPSHPLDATRVEHFWDLDEATPAEQSLAAPAE
jgi:thioredoxin 1